MEKSMKKIFMELTKESLDRYQTCTESHEPNDITKQTLENIKKGKELKKTSSVENLFKKLRS